MTIHRPFYSGENIDLVVPLEQHVWESSWPYWLNDELTTRFTTHGLMPNSPAKQKKFFESLTEDSRFALLITAPSGQVPIGVVSLSGIDFRSGRCAVAIIMDLKSEVTHSPLAALEAMAFVTSHAFEVLGLRRIDAGQVYPDNERWRKSLQLLGYRAEGIKREAFKRGNVIKDEVLLGCTLMDYLEIKQARDGHFWPGNSHITKELSRLPAQSIAQQLDKYLRSIEN